MHKPSRWDFKKASIKAKKYKGGMFSHLCNIRGNNAIRGTRDLSTLPMLNHSENWKELCQYM